MLGILYVCKRYIIRSCWFLSDWIVIGGCKLIKFFDFCYCCNWRPICFFMFAAPIYNKIFDFIPINSAHFLLIVCLTIIPYVIRILFVIIIINYNVWSTYQVSSRKILSYFNKTSLTITIVIGYVSKQRGEGNVLII